ncbi:MAG: cyclic nucleotide-binding domain-containing protein, partial [Caulobacteraceae bacterium]
MRLAGLAMSFARGEEICAQDEAADLIYQVVKGMVRMSRVDRDGRRQIA